MQAAAHPLPPPHQARKQRADGAEARGQLLLAALRLFAEKGFAKTSIRAIAQAAGANVAAIRYYFGDKAGLYRTVFTEALGTPLCADMTRYQAAHLSLRQALEGLMADFLAPMKQSELAQQLTRLSFREMLEPTGLWAEQVDSGVFPAHTALVAVLSRHLGIPQADDDVHRLAFSIHGLAMQMFVTRDAIEAVRPQLIATPQAIDLWAARLADFAEAMVVVEQARRQSRPLEKKRKT